MYGYNNIFYVTAPPHYLPYFARALRPIGMGGGGEGSIYTSTGKNFK